MTQGLVEHIRWYRDEGVAVVEVLSRELNIPEAALELGAQLRGLLASNAADRVVVNLGRTSYMSSTAFAVLFDVGKEARASGVKLALCELTPDVRVGADIIRLGSMIPIHATQADAVAAVKAG